LDGRFDFTSGTQEWSSTTEIHYLTREQKQFKQNTSGTGLDVSFSVSGHDFDIHSVYRLIRRPSFYSRTIRRKESSDHIHIRSWHQ